jgi:hypothetical protein
MNPAQLRTNLQYHAPDAPTQVKIERLRSAYIQLTHAIETVDLPVGRAAAISTTKLEESLMWAVKSLVIPNA